MCFKTFKFDNIFFCLEAESICYSFMRNFHTNTTLPHEIEFIQKKNFCLFYEQEKILLMQKKMSKTLCHLPLKACFVSTAKQDTTTSSTSLEGRDCLPFPCHSTEV
jgi:hypothetical protein